MESPKTRFSGRAGNYARYRPGYPKEILAFLESRCAFTDDSVVADLGSGTGILSAMFLENGNRVFAVEPNEEMREAAERLLGRGASLPRFESVAGSAEATTLADGSVDLVAVGNSFHWFDHDAVGPEFSRILKPGGSVAIVWNVPRNTGTPFLEALERLLSEYRTRIVENPTGIASEEDIYDRTEAFFGGSAAGGSRRNYAQTRFPNSQHLDLEGLKGLVLSYSNVPAEGEPGAAAMLRDLTAVFRANESGGEVVMQYVARVYCGRLHQAKT